MGGYWDIFSDGIFDYAMGAYSSLDPWVYPIFFTGIIGFMFLVTGSATIAASVIIVTLGMYAFPVFVEVPELTLFYYIIVLLVFTLLLTVLFIKRRN